MLGGLFVEGKVRAVCGFYVFGGEAGRQYASVSHPTFAEMTENSYDRAKEHGGGRGGEYLAGFIGGTDLLGAH